MPAIPYRKLKVTVPIPLASKLQKSTTGCLNKRFNSGEKSIACTSMFAANINVVSQKKIDRSERLYGGQVRCSPTNGTTI